MATPALAATVRFIEPSLAKYYWVPSIANTSSPTRIEMNAGTDLTAQVAEVSGFSVSSDLVDAPDFGSRQVSRIAGKITPADSSFTIYRSNTSSDVRSLLTRDLTGFVIVFGEGDVAGKKMDVFPVVVVSRVKSHSWGDPATIEVQFGITGTVVEDVTVPS